MKNNLIEIAKALPHILHAVKLALLELVFFAWGLAELGRFALQVMGGHHGE